MSHKIYSMKRYIFFLTIVCTGFLFLSCSKNFTSINTDPEHLTSVNFQYKYLFTSAELITSGNSDANSYEDERDALGYLSCMVQHLSSTVGYYPGDKYLYNASYNGAYWEQNYQGPVKNIQEVIFHTKSDATQTNFYNIARIFRVFIFQRITDMYGDCPYSEAGLGYITGNTSPKYDKQKDIYTDMLNELQDAATKLDPSASNTLGSADQLYGGDPTAWKKFAYSEMLRLAMRMVKVDPATAQNWAKTAIAGGVMAAISDNAAFSHNNYTQSTPTVNGIALVINGYDNNATRVSKTLIDMLKNTNDPRLSYYATVSTDPTNTDPNNPISLGDNTASIQLGQPNGYDNAGGLYDISKAPNWPNQPSVSTPDSLVQYQNRYSIVNRNTFGRFDAPTYFLTYAETALLEAEAAQRGWISGDPASFYTAGVTAAMQQLGQLASMEGSFPAATLPPIPDTTIANYLSANPFNPAQALNQINTQYWLATYMDEYEAWANYRRTGFPTLVPVAGYPGNVTGGTIPRRFTYSTLEVSDNNANYIQAVSGLNGGDKMTSRVWWDVSN